MKPYQILRREQGVLTEYQRGLGTPDRSVNRVLITIETELKYLTDSQYEPTVYLPHTCDICGKEEQACLSVLCSYKYQGHIQSGQKMVCKSCLDAL
jgi:hypothetical protein